MFKQYPLNLSQSIWALIQGDISIEDLATKYGVSNKIINEIKLECLSQGERRALRKLNSKARVQVYLTKLLKTYCNYLPTSIFGIFVSILRNLYFHDIELFLSNSVNKNKELNRALILTGKNQKYAKYLMENFGISYSLALKVAYEYKKYGIKSGAEFIEKYNKPDSIKNKPDSIKNKPDPIKNEPDSIKESSPSESKIKKYEFSLILISAAVLTIIIFSLTHKDQTSSNTNQTNSNTNQSHIESNKSKLFTDLADPKAKYEMAKKLLDKHDYDSAIKLLNVINTSDYQLKMKVDYSKARALRKIGGFKSSLIAYQKVVDD